MFRFVSLAVMLSMTLAWHTTTPAASSAQPAQPTEQAIAPFEMVKDINPGTSPVGSMADAGLFATLGDGAVFSAHTPSAGNELWRTNGTDAGTQLVKDINPGEGSALASYDPQWVMLGGALLFAADDGATGVELWRSDGTTQGTHRVGDLRPGAESSEPRRFIASGNRVFFTASLSETSHALWASDGTPEGTLPLRTFQILGEVFVRSNGTLLFSAADAGNNLELWQSDGTPDGTALVADINPGPGGSDPTKFFEKAPNVVLFSADNGVHGRELWSTDGTAGSTTMVKDIIAGAASSSPAPMAIVTTTIFNVGAPPTRISLVLLRVQSAQRRWELWATDGLPDGIVKHTQLLHIGGDIYSVAPPTVIGMQTISIGNFLIEQAVLSMADVNSRGGVWASDGRVEGTRLISDKATPTVSEKKSVAQFGGVFFYPAFDRVAGNELWRSAGTSASTVRVADLFAGELDGSPRDLTVLGERLLFTASGGRGRELYRSTGDEAALVKDVWPGPMTGVSRILGAVGGTLYFIGNDGASGDELWKSDGTEAGTALVKNLAPDVGSIGVPGDGFAVLDDRLMFGAAEQLLDKRKLAEATATTTQAVSAASAITPALWVSNGTANGTTALKTFVRSPESESGRSFMPRGLTALNDGVLFIGGDGADVNELWRTDGTSAGTTILTNTVKPFLGTPFDLRRVNDLALFGVMTETRPGDADGAPALWRSDGTPQGTRAITTGLQVLERTLAASGNTLFFAAGQQGKPEDGITLWKSDGTLEGTVKVVPGAQPLYITPAAPGSVFFIVRGEVYELWKSDGSAAGTTLVREVPLIDERRVELQMTWVNGTLFFVADDGVSGAELWKSDGTRDGTGLLMDMYPGAGSSSPRDLVGMNGRLYFSATGPDGARTLWQSDGTPADTTSVSADADRPMNPQELAVIAGQLMFSAADPAHGRELWRSDGTPAGTRMLQDIAAGSESSNPRALAATGKHAYLTAYTPQAGAELWAAKLVEPVPPPTPPAGSKRMFLPMVQK